MVCILAAMHGLPSNKFGVMGVMGVMAFLFCSELKKGQRYNLMKGLC